jgi:hypothetical protein|tara:strand:+ start:634 stop:1209 length:576 start_codon:yes stop_codon:yes gene_type:complete
MALWSNNDNIGVSSINALANVGSGLGIVTVTSAGAVTGGIGVCTFTNLEVGNTILLGAGQTSGFGVITSIASDTSMSITTSAVDDRDFAAGNNYTTRHMKFSTQPVSVDEDPAYAPSSADDQRGYNSKIFAVTEGILGEPGGRSDYLDAVSHGGWVGVTTYTDNHGELRIKTETLVAMSGITTGNRAYPIT